MLTGLSVFVVCVAILAIGYFCYGRLAERVYGPFGPKVMPAVSAGDGVDYIPLPTWKVFLIQLLNIAGLGPVFGALSGALFGPAALLWIVFGCILAGAMHDFLATVLPIDVIIGRIYPIFGALFIFMAVGLLVSMPFGEYEVLPQLDFFTNVHPDAHLSIWPMIFVTIACGAISGFHATQSPLMVRCLPERRNMRRVFYGAMIVEGLVALIWATVGLTLRNVLTDYTLVEQGGKMVAHAVGADASAVRATFMQLCIADPASAVNQACTDYLGSVGAIIAVIGVVVLPITSGDTAMRSCRLMIADMLHINQEPKLKRFGIAIPLFAAVIIISEIDFGIIWRYFGWSNQLLSCFTLWAIAVLLRRRNRWYWMALLPALFMTTVCSAYLLCSPECAIGLPVGVSTWIGVGLCVLALIGFFRIRRGCDSLEK